MNTMSVISRGSSGASVDLSEQATIRLLEVSKRRGASIRLEVKSAEIERVLHGRVVGTSQQGLMVQLDQESEEPVLPSTCCDAALRYEGQDYMFASHLLAWDVDGDRVVLEVASPDVVCTWQRRRFVRATLADSARVYFSRPDEFEAILFDGAMLNVSPDGMACRVDVVDAGRQAVGEPLGVGFVLRPGQDVIALNATVKSKTPGGTPGTIILGVQFVKVDTHCGQHARLVEVLDLCF